jgi:hypothetical protein
VRGLSGVPVTVSPDQRSSKAVLLKNPHTRSIGRFHDSGVAPFVDGATSKHYHVSGRRHKVWVVRVIVRANPVRIGSYIEKLTRTGNTTDALGPRHAKDILRVLVNKINALETVVAVWVHGNALCGSEPFNDGGWCGHRVSSYKYS